MKAVPRLSTLTDVQSVQMEFARAAFGCMNAENIVFISTPITTGKRLYDYMEEKGLTPGNVHDDYEAFIKAVVQPNIDENIAWAAKWRGRTKGVVIAPSEFEASRAKGVAWSQDTYMTMWLSIIDQNVTKQVLQPGWAYSDGAAEEYLHVTCMQAGLRPRSDIRTVDTQGRDVSLARGIRIIADAFMDLREKGMKTERLATTLARLIILEERYAAGALAQEAQQPIALPPYSHEALAPVCREVMAILEKDYGSIVSALKAQKTAAFTPLNVLVPDAKPAAKRPRAAACQP